jgi:hypothetical protein
MSERKTVLKVLSLGGGVQSSTIAEMIVERELPPVDFAVFADTGDDPDHVIFQVRYLVRRLASVGIPLHIVQNKNGSIIDQIYRTVGRFASIPVYTKLNGKIGMMRRQCTREFKIEPIEKLLRRKLLEMGYVKKTKADSIIVNKEVQVLNLIGISLDEAQRMKHNRRKWNLNFWPLIDFKMTRNDCAIWLDKKGLPLPGKSSCRICPFHSKANWREMKENRPADWDHVVKVDEFLRTENHFTAGMKGELFLYRECIPLKDVDFTEDDNQSDFFEICDGYCFI